MVREVVITQEWLMTHLPQRLGVSPRKFPGAINDCWRFCPKHLWCGVFSAVRVRCNLISHGAPKIGGYPWCLSPLASVRKGGGLCREINGLG